MKISSSFLFHQDCNANRQTGTMVSPCESSSRKSCQFEIVFSVWTTAQNTHCDFSLPTFTTRCYILNWKKRNSSPIGSERNRSFGLYGFTAEFTELFAVLNPPNCSKIIQNRCMWPNHWPQNIFCESSFLGRNKSVAKW